MAKVDSHTRTTKSGKKTQVRGHSRKGGESPKSARRRQALVNSALALGVVGGGAAAVRSRLKQRAGAHARKAANRNAVKDLWEKQLELIRKASNFRRNRPPKYSTSPSGNNMRYVGRQ